MGKSLTQKEFLSLCRSVHNDKYLYNKTVYVNAREPVVITCKLHGDFKQRAHSHMSGMGCRLCSAKAKIVPLKYSTREFVQLAKAAHSNKYVYGNTVYLGTNKPVVITCKLHGDFSQRASSHLSGQGCPECANLGRRAKLSLSTETFIEKAKAAHGENYDYSKVSYKHHDKKVSIICKKHGVFNQTPANHTNQKEGCPECGFEKNRASYSNGSVIEKKVARWMGRYGTVSRNNRSVLAPSEIDIWCAEHKLGVEVNGTYWHRSEIKPKSYHYDKALAARKARITLLQFWDHELIRKPDICKSMILSRAGKNISLGARSCVIKELTAGEQRVFFDENHLQGYSYASLCYGLVTDDGIQAAMSFCEPRFNKGFDWEIIRYANKLGTSVSGGASRLWKHFLLEKKPKSVLTYADLRYSIGSLYKTLGFKLVRATLPGYFYSRGQEVLSRFSAQKKKLPKLLGVKFKPSLSEYDNMKACGWYKVYDAGNLVFSWKS